MLCSRDIRNRTGATSTPWTRTTTILYPDMNTGAGGRRPPAPVIGRDAGIRTLSHWYPKPAC